MMEHLVDPEECWFIRDDTHLFAVITYQLEEGWWETTVLEKGTPGPLEIHRWDNHRQSITGHAVVWKRVTDKENGPGGETSVYGDHSMTNTIERKHRQYQEYWYGDTERCCAKCGYSKCVRALEFHHVNPESKSFNLNQNAFGRSWAQLKREMERCILLCANCHMELHAGQWDLSEEEKARYPKEKNTIFDRPGRPKKVKA